jgi:hypothetical protein
MRLLVEGLGQASQMDERDWEAMVLEWLAVGAVSADVHEQLERRFMRGLMARPAKNTAAPALRGHDRRDARAERDAGERKSRRDAPGRSGGFTRR